MHLIDDAGANAPDLDVEGYQAAWPAELGYVRVVLHRHPALVVTVALVVLAFREIGDAFARLLLGEAQFPISIGGACGKSDLAGLGKVTDVPQRIEWARNFQKSTTVVSKWRTKSTIRDGEATPLLPFR